jgi:CRP/FNR family cyclic AMP-dependent transcriptional regulator
MAAANQTIGGEAARVDWALLLNIPLFSKLSPEELTALTLLLKTRRFVESEPIVYLGDDGSEFYIVQHGRVAVSHPDESGKEVTLAELGPGNFFGEISLLDGGPRTATVRAEGDVTLLSLERGQFVQFLLQHPAAAVHILTILGARQRELLEKLRGIRNVNEAVLRRQTRLQRTVSHLAGIFASERFLLFNLVFITTWVVVHSLIWHDKIKWRDEPPTFFWLGFIITAESIVVAMFVLNSQRRQAERDRVRGDLEYQVNVKAHVEVMELHRKVDRLLEAGNLKK